MRVSQPRWPGERLLERHIAPTSSVILGSTQDPEPWGVALAALDPGFRQDDGRGRVVAGAGAILWRLPFPSSRRTPGPMVADRVITARYRWVRRNHGSRRSPGGRMGFRGAADAGGLRGRAGAARNTVGPGLRVWAAAGRTPRLQLCECDFIALPPPYPAIPADAGTHGRGPGYDGAVSPGSP